MGQVSERRAIARLHDYVSLSRQRANEGHLPLWRQMAEMLGLLVLTGNGPGLYHIAGLWRREIEWADKLAQLGHFAYRRRLRSLNAPGFVKLAQNKLVEKGLMTLVGVPTPTFLGFLHPVKGRAADGCELRTADDLVQLIESRALERFCVKRVQGWAGRNFDIVEAVRDAGRLRLHLSGAGRTVDVEEFIEMRRVVGGKVGSILEEYLVQHPQMAAFNPSSVNTYRIWVREGRDGRGYVRLAYLRMGRAGAIVDNQSAGGIVAPVNLDSGIISAALDGLPERRTFPCHPDHGAPIAGQPAPLWQESRQLAATVLELFPGLRFAGVDVAVSTAGPVILELNPSPDRIGAAFVDVSSKWALAEPTVTGQGLHDVPPNLPAHP
jgi:hypothetical protein